MRRIESGGLPKEYGEPLLFEPGTEVEQSATNFLLLTKILEKFRGWKHLAYILYISKMPLNLGKRTAMHRDAAWQFFCYATQYEYSSRPV